VPHRSARRLAAGLVGLVALSVLSPLAPASASPVPVAVPAAATDGCEMVLPPMAPGEPVSCAHADEPPAGVDVTRSPSTAELEARHGTSATVVAAAQEAGVPTPSAYATGSTVPCASDDDGTSGYRVQAMYVVTPDRTNRFADLQGQFQTWAAGVEDVFNRSAAQTGGVRHVRFVSTNNHDGTCTPTVLNVTVPNGSNAGFGQTITAVRNAGYTNPARKYLMWTDASVLCGIANMYQYSQPDQGNPNNGSYAQYARIDTGCWGGTYSVEAHELMHNMGGVQNISPNHSPNGHCVDESDRMCYSDAAGVTMRSVCPAGNEALFDCNNDDYFSTYPAAGSYLDTHWNTADNRFLVGGGNGADGGTGGAATRLMVGIAVNNPAVAGLPTQVTATPEDVPGRSVSVLWRSARADCVFADPTATQTTVTCLAGSSALTTLTVTADNGGATAPVSASSPLTFSTAARTAALATVVDGVGGATSLTVCPTGKLPVVATVTDAASAAPARGVKVEFTRTVAGVTGVVGSAVSGADGRATATVLPVAGMTLGVRTVTVGVFAARTGAGTVLTPAGTACATTVTSSLDSVRVGYGQPVVATGRLETSVGGRTTGVLGETVTLAFTPAGSATATTLASAVTDASGAFRLAGAAKATGSVSVRHAATAAHLASTGPAAALTVYPWTTAVSAAVSDSSVAYKQPVLVSGTLTRTGDGVTGPAAGRPVLVRMYAPGGALLAAATTATGAGGTYTATLLPAASGTVLVSSPEAPGYAPSSSGDLAVTVTPWTTSLSVTSATPTAVAYRGPVKVTGTVARSFDGSTGPAAGVKVSLVLTPAAGGMPTVVGSAVTGTSGAFTGTALPTANGTLSAKVVDVPGYTTATASTTTPVTVAAALSLAASRTSATTGGFVTLTAKMLPLRDSATLTLQRQLGGGTWSTVGSLTLSGGTGSTVVTAGPAGTYAYRVLFAGDTGNAAGSSAPRTLTVT
jgi:5-hydroxyisourate hydrolase-like protein (transthyretin family)